MDGLEIPANGQFVLRYGLATRLKTSLLLILRHVLGEDGKDPKRISLRLLDESLLNRFQTVMVNRYVAKAGPDPSAQREARERPLRSSRSTIRQARSLFNRQKQLPKRYAEAGIRLPANMDQFMTCRLVGRSLKREYLAPPDELVQRAFSEVEKFRKVDLECFLAFWFAVGAGLRRAEIQRLRWEQLVQREGAF